MYVVSVNFSICMCPVQQPDSNPSEAQLKKIKMLENNAKCIFSDGIFSPLPLFILFIHVLYVRSLSTESEPNKCLSIGLFPFFFFVSFLVLPKCFQPNQVQVYSRKKILKCQHRSQHKMPQSEKSAEVAENCTDVNRTCVKVCCGRRRFPFHGTEQAPTYCAVGGGRCSC